MKADDAATSRGNHELGHAERAGVHASRLGSIHGCLVFHDAAADAFVVGAEGAAPVFAPVFVDGSGTRTSSGQKSDGSPKPWSSADGKKLPAEGVAGTCLTEGTEGAEGMPSP